jgi:hypothetical protein
MQYDELKELNAKFAEETVKFNKEFSDLFKKWLKKSPRLAIVMSIHLPINMIMGVISLDEENDIYQVFPELPDMFIRFVAPFIKLRKQWGKISGDEFTKEYQRLYESQFDKFFMGEEEKKEFKNWFEKENE